MLDDITEYMKGVLVSPTAHHPFNIAEDVTKLSQVDSDIFHHLLAQLLYLSKRALTDIQLGVSFLLISVRGPDTAEYNNISRIMKYIQGTIDLLLILLIRTHKVVC